MQEILHPENWKYCVRGIATLYPRHHVVSDLFLHRTYLQNAVKRKEILPVVCLFIILFDLSTVSLFGEEYIHEARH
jgi:hypothetical protein